MSASRAGCAQAKPGRWRARWPAWLLVVIVSGTAQGQPPAPLPYQVHDQTIGTVNCASSLCHGSITEWKGSPILRNEYVTWSRLDKHARAYTVLSGESARRIASKLGLPGPASEAKVCLDCHAHNVPLALREPRFKLSDGVTCEACHGPAQRWIASHVEPGASHAGNLAHGLYPTDDSGARARLCLSCHWGNKDKFVSHRMLGAGHPRLSFELETFSSIEPAHYRVDGDYLQRKQAVDGVKTWAIGQALAVSEMMDILVDPRRGRDGLFPELVLFDCHACHHPMSKRRWQPQRAFGAGAGPGVARLNDSGMQMMRAIARRLDPKLGARVSAQVARLHRATAGQGDALAEARVLKRLAQEVAERVASATFTQASLRAIALDLVDEGLAGKYGDYANAEQASMAVGSVVSFMHKRGMLASVAAVNRGLDRLNATLADDENFDPALFRQRLREFRAILVSG